MGPPPYVENLRRVPSVPGIPGWTSQFRERRECQDPEDITVVSSVGVSAIDAPPPTGLRDLLRRKRFAGSEYTFATPAPNNAATKMAKMNKIGTPRMGLPA